MIRLILGIGIMVASVFAGLYVGGYFMFFKGLEGIINGIKLDWNATMIAFGILKMVFASFTGVVTAVIGIFIGWLISGLK